MSRPSTYLGILLVTSVLGLVDGEATAQAQVGWVKATGGPEVGQDAAMAYDLARHRIVLFGGARNVRAFGGGTSYFTSPVADTWLYGYPAATQAFGNACSGSSSSPILASEAPYLGHPAFALELIGARPASPCAFGLATARLDQPIPPCTLYLKGTIVPLLAVTNWAGFARSQTFALPLNPNLHGLTFYAQAFVADPQGPVGGLTFSGGLKLVVGD